MAAVRVCVPMCPGRITVGVRRVTVYRQTGSRVSVSVLSLYAQYTLQQARVPIETNLFHFRQISPNWLILFRLRPSKR